MYSIPHIVYDDTQGFKGKNGAIYFYFVKMCFRFKTETALIQGDVWFRSYLNEANVILARGGGFRDFSKPARIHILLLVYYNIG